MIYAKMRKVEPKKVICSNCGKTEWSERGDETDFAAPLLNWMTINNDWKRVKLCSFKCFKEYLKGNEDID